MATSLALGLGLFGQAEAHDIAKVDGDSDDDRKVIIVTGRRGTQPGIDRIASPAAENPQTISTITREELEARGVSNLNDALRNVAGLSLGAGETSYQGNNAILRGFTTRNDLFVDNARDFGYYFRDSFNDETVEVLKGPSGILFGRGSTGGVIHRISKAPRSATSIEGQLQFGLDDTRRATIDANIANPAGNGTALRINGLAHSAGVAGRDGALSRRWAVAPTFAAELSGATRVALSYLHQEEGNRPDYGIPWYGGTPTNPGYPVPVRRDAFYGFSNDRLNTNVNIVTGRVDQDLGDKARLTASLRYSNNSRDFRYSEAVLPPGTLRTAALDSISVGRNLFEGSARDAFLQGQVTLGNQFAIGATKHELISGFELGTEESDPVYVTNLGVPGTSLSNPVITAYDNPANRFVRLRARSRSFAAGVFAIDTISIGDRWRLIGGIRWDSFATRYTSTRFTQNGAADRTSDVDRTDRKLSLRGAIVYKPAPHGTVYVSYANSFNPSGEGIESLISSGRAVSEANLNLAPETSFTVELGSKWEILGERVLISAAIFRIEKNNARVPNPDTPGFNALGGRQRVDGLDVEVGGQVLPGLDVRAGYSYLDSKTVASAPGGPIIGAPLPITARHSGFFSTAYAVSRRFTVGANITALSGRLAQNTAGAYLIAPGYGVVDLNARYRFSDHLSVQLVVNNIADALYYEQLHPFHVIPGAGRTALVTIRAAL